MAVGGAGNNHQKKKKKETKMGNVHAHPMPHIRFRGLKKHEPVQFESKVFFIRVVQILKQNVRLCDSL